MAIFGNKKTNTPAEKTAPKAAQKAAPAPSMKDLYSDAPTVRSSKLGAKVKKTIDHALTSRVLIKPLITEKATNLGAENKYIFVVSASANKISVAKAVEATYGVKPTSVNLLNVSGKKVTRGRISGQRKDWKKAVVTLKKGEAIKIYEGV